MEAPPAHTLEFNWAPVEVAAAPPTSNWPVLNLTKIAIKQPRDTITKVAGTEKDNFCKTYAEALKLKKHEKAARVERKMPSPRHRAQQDDADDLVEVCVKDMEHEKASILRRNIRNILNDDQHCLHVRYMQADRVELLVPRHQEQAVIQRLTKVGHSVVNNYSVEGIQVRRDGTSEDQRQRRNAYCDHRAMTRTLNRGNLGRSVTLFYAKKRDAIEAEFPQVFTTKGQAEFDLEYGVHPEKNPPTTTTAHGSHARVQPRDNSVPTVK